MVAAYVIHNHLQAAEMPTLIASVHAALSDLGQAAAPEATAEPLKPAVPIKKSITDDYLISLETGQRFKALKRHLASLGMTPAQYRRKWNLPRDYPTTAPTYAAQRSASARSTGLRNTRRKG